jgi:toxin secretion/phage lysis holin
MDEIKEIVEAVHFTSMMWLLLIPAAMMGIDIITGLIYAFLTNSFKSARMRSGLGKKAGELLIILMGMMFCYGMGIPKYVLSAVSLYIIFMEFMSVMENMKKLGVPIPAFVSKVLDTANDVVNHSEDIDELKEQMKEMQKLIDSSNLK